MAGPWETYNWGTPKDTERGSLKPWEHDYGSSEVKDALDSKVKELRRDVGLDPTAFEDVQEQVVNALGAIPRRALGLPGDIESIIQTVGTEAINRVRTNLARGTGKEPERYDGPGKTLLPTSDQVMEATNFEPRQADTELGRISGDMVEMAGGGAIFGSGPIKIARNIAKSAQRGPAALGKAGADAAKDISRGAIKFGTIPGMVSEAFGQGANIFDDMFNTAIEPAARMAGAAMAAGGSALAGRTRPRQIRDLAPSLENIQNTTKAFLTQAKSKGLILDNKKTDQLVQDLFNSISKNSYDPSLHEGVNKVLSNIYNRIGTPQGLDDLADIRQLTVDVMLTSPRDERIARQIVASIDDFVYKLSPEDTVAYKWGSANVNNDISTAQTMWKRNIKAREIDSIFQEATRAIENGTDFEEALRRGFQKLNENDERLNIFSKKEQSAIRKVAHGGNFANLSRGFGNLIQEGTTSLLAGGLGGTAGAIAGSAVGLPVVGAMAGASLPVMAAGARGFARNAINRKAAMADALVRGGGPPRVPPSDMRKLPVMLPYYQGVQENN